MTFTKPTVSLMLRRREKLKGPGRRDKNLNPLFGMYVVAAEPGTADTNYRRAKKT